MRPENFCNTLYRRPEQAPERSGKNRSMREMSINLEIRQMALPVRKGDASPSHTQRGKKPRLYTFSHVTLDSYSHLQPGRATLQLRRNLQRVSFQSIPLLWHCAPR